MHAQLYDQERNHLDWIDSEYKEYKRNYSPNGGAKELEDYLRRGGKENNQVLDGREVPEEQLEID